MPILNTPNAAFPAESKAFLAIAVCVSNPRVSQRHLALLYGNGSPLTLRLSHLEWENHFTDESWEDGLLRFEYRWQTMPVLSDPLYSATLVAALKKLKKPRSQYQFGFKRAGCKFVEEENEIVLRYDGEGAGLTCATFVCSFLESILRFPVVTDESWPHRDEDRLWKERILEQLRPSISAVRAAEIQRGLDDVRIRPEESAAALLHGALPVNFNECVDRALAIVAELQPALPLPVPAPDPAPQAGPAGPAN